MAVVQISKIQHRRGRKGTTNLPQLASGELGWAIDTQELFIGNGSVAEGAPYVGNTKILTEHDNILDLARQYQYKRNDPAIQTGEFVTQPVTRSIQDRLDDVVFVKSFGAIGNGEADDYAALQRAIDELFLNDATKASPLSRVVLEIHPGIFNISQPLKIPPYANIRGAGKDKTIIRQVGTAQDKYFSVFYTVSGDSTPSTYIPRMIDASTDVTIESFSSLNQPRYISIEGITFKNSVAGFPVALLHATKNSKFTNIKFEGIWSSSVNLTEAEAGVNLIAKSSLVTSKDNIFEGCDVVNLSYAIYSTHDIESNLFSKCLISNCGTGVLFGNQINGSSGKVYGPKNNRFVSNRFVEINRHGIKVVNGKGNLSSSNTFIAVGNDGLSSNTAHYPVLDFSDSGNVSDGDYFERSYDLSAATTNNPYISEFGGSVTGNHKFNAESPVDQSSGVLLRLSAFNNAGYVVHYIYSSNVAGVVRQGRFEVTADVINSKALLTEEYDFTGPPANAERIIFAANLVDRSSPLDGVKETIEITYENNTTNDTGVVKYWYEVIS